MTYKQPPQDLSIDPFYSAINQTWLKQAIENYESGKSKPIKKSMEELESIAEDDA